MLITTITLVLTKASGNGYLYPDQAHNNREMFDVEPFSASSMITGETLHE